MKIHTNITKVLQMETVEPKKFIEWNQDFSVGIEELDNHHKELIHLINSLQEAIDADAGVEKIAVVITELFNYANYHFGAEEALFQIRDYPLAQEHCEKHLEFRKDMAEHRDMVEAEIDFARLNLLSYLQLWWTNHILQEDKKYVAYLSG